MTKKRLHHADEARFAEAEAYALATIAFILTDAMALSGLSQRRLADRLGVSEARISQVLNATGNPTVKSLARIADAMNCRLQIRFAELSAAERRPDVHLAPSTIEPDSSRPPTGATIVEDPPDNVIQWTCHDRARRAWSAKGDDCETTPPSETYRHALLG